MFSNLDLLQKAGFPKTRDLSPATPRVVCISRKDSKNTKNNLGNDKNMKNRHLLIKWLPFLCFFVGPHVFFGDPPHRTRRQRRPRRRRRRRRRPPRPPLTSPLSGTASTDRSRSTRTAAASPGGAGTEGSATEALGGDAVLNFLSICSRRS